MGGARTATGTDGDAAWVGHLFEQHDTRTGIVRFNGGDGAGITETDDDDIDDLVVALAGLQVAHIVHRG